MKSIINKRYWMRLLVVVTTVFSATAFQSTSHANASETLFLMISDGALGSNVFQDISGSNIQVTPTGNTHHSSAQSKFGDTSIQFDGNGDYLSVVQDPLYAVGAGDFTIDMWIFLNSPNAVIFSNYDFPGAAGIQAYQGYGQLGVLVAGAASMLTASPLPTGVWNHLAIVRSTTQLSVYVNGSLVASGALYSSYTGSSNPTSFGCLATFPTLFPLNGYVDAVRYTKSAIWNNNFTPPTTAAPVPQSKWKATETNYLVTEGNVGIGTETPQSALAVNGTITAKEVVVTDSGWADYVFDQSFILPELTSLESFINQNRHLPGIPQSSAIAKSGISVSEMFRLQMQKIEELTLYVIALEKQNREMGEKIRLLEAEHGRRVNPE